jgi:mannose-6-phosphate isomerase-like protein (cupin superfamily)
MLGTGMVTVGEMAPEKVGPGDVVIIPAGTAQQISNTGDTDLVFYCICTPRFSPESYESLE